MPQYLTPNGNPIMNWGPIHDMIISLHVMGYGNEAIASLTEKTRNHIARVIKDPRGQKAIVTVRKSSFKVLAKTVEERMSTLGAQAIDNIAETINENLRGEDGKAPVGTKAKVHQDSVSFELLKRIGYGGRSQEVEPGGIRLSPEAEKRLIDGIERAQTAEADYVRVEVESKALASGE